MCMKKQRTYRPKGLTKEEERYLDSLVKRELVLTIFVILAGVAVVIGLFIVAQQAAAL